MHPASILPGDIVEFVTGNMGRIVSSRRHLPVGMLWAVVCGETKARQAMPVYASSILKVKRNGSNWKQIRHPKTALLGGLR